MRLYGGAPVRFGVEGVRHLVILGFQRFQFRETVRRCPARLVRRSRAIASWGCARSRPTGPRRPRPEVGTLLPRSPPSSRRLFPLSRRVITRRIVLSIAPRPIGRRHDPKTSERSRRVRRASSGSRPRAGVAKPPGSARQRFHYLDHRRALPHLQERSQRGGHAPVASPCRTSGRPGHAPVRDAVAPVAHRRHPERIRPT